jgi:hypothetical protein
VVFPLSMWAEIPMFRSFEKSVYTSYLHLRERTDQHGRIGARRCSPGVPAGEHGHRSCRTRRASLHFSRWRRVPKRAPFTHLDGVERAQPRTIDGETQPGARRSWGADSRWPQRFLGRARSGEAPVTSWRPRLHRRHGLSVLNSTFDTLEVDPGYRGGIVPGTSDIGGRWLDLKRTVKRAIGWPILCAFDTVTVGRKDSA